MFKETIAQFNFKRCIIPLKGDMALDDCVAFFLIEIAKIGLHWRQYYLQFPVNSSSCIVFFL